MTAVNRTTLYSYFLTGLRPTQQQFANLIDSCLNLTDSGAQIINSNVTVSGALTVVSSLAVSGNVTINGTLTNTSAATFNSLTVTNQSSLAGLSISGSTSAVNISATGTLNVGGQTTLASAKGVTAALGTATTDLATTLFVNPDTSAAAIGFRTNPDGIIEQWGSAIVSSGGGSIIPFAKAFSTSVYSLTTGKEGSSGVFINSLTTSSVNLQTTTGGQNNVYWMAVGK